MTRTDILQRCCECPDDHLAEASLDHYMVYDLGYESHSPLDNEEWDHEAFTAAVMEDYGVKKSWPRSLSPLSFLVAAEGRTRALRRYLDYRKRFAKFTGEKSSLSPSPDLLTILASPETIRRYPVLYMGNQASAAHLWSMISGARWAELDAGTPTGKATLFLESFQKWLEQRYPFSKGIPWYRTLNFLCMSDSEDTLRTFFAYFDSFQKGERPDNEDSTGNLDS